jgi:hypothetical protein
MVFRDAFQAMIFTASTLLQRFTVRMLLLLGFVFNTLLHFVELPYINVWRVEKQCSVWYNQCWGKRTEMSFVFNYKFPSYQNQPVFELIFSRYIHLKEFPEKNFTKRKEYFVTILEITPRNFEVIVLLWSVREIVFECSVSAGIRGYIPPQNSSKHISTWRKRFAFRLLSLYTSFSQSEWTEDLICA